jgi:hypothetical protein
VIRHRRGKAHLEGAVADGREWRFRAPKSCRAYHVRRHWRSRPGRQTADGGAVEWGRKRVREGTGKGTDADAEVDPLAPSESGALRAIHSTAEPHLFSEDAQRELRRLANALVGACGRRRKQEPQFEPQFAPLRDRSSTSDSISKQSHLQAAGTEEISQPPSAIYCICHTGRRPPHSPHPLRPTPAALQYQHSHFVISLPTSAPLTHDTPSLSHPCLGDTPAPSRCTARRPWPCAAGRASPQAAAARRRRAPGSCPPASRCCLQQQQ